MTTNAKTVNEITLWEPTIFTNTKAKMIMTWLAGQEASSWVGRLPESAKTELLRLYPLTGSLFSWACDYICNMPQDEGEWHAAWIMADDLRQILANLPLYHGKEMVAFRRAEYVRCKAIAEETNRKHHEKKVIDDAMRKARIASRFVVVGGQYMHVYYGTRKTLQGAMRLASANMEYWDNWQGWHYPAIYYKSECRLCRGEWIPRENATPVAKRVHGGRWDTNLW